MRHLFVLALVPWSACAVVRDAKLAREPLESGDLVAVFPPDGATVLYGDLPVEVVLGEAAAGELPIVTATWDGGTAELSCALTEGGSVADCGTLPVTDLYAPVSLTVAAGDTELTVTSEPGQPPVGIGWDLFAGTTFSALGSGDEAAVLANDYLRSGDAFATLVGYAGEPGSYRLVGGSAHEKETDVFAALVPGFAFVLDATLAQDGTLTARADTAWLPATVEGEVVHLLLLDVHLRAQLVGEELRDLRLSAHLPALALEELAAPLGVLGPEVLELVKLDVDRDGDGTDDAASVVLEGAPTPATLAAWADQG